MYRLLTFLLLASTSLFAHAKAESKHCLQAAYSAKPVLSEVVVTANLRPCHRAEATDLDRWQVSTALAYRTRSNLVLSTGYRHEQKHYPAKTLESTYWQQMIAEHRLSGGIGFVGARAEQASHRTGTRFSLRTGVSHNIHERVEVTLANDLTWRNGQEEQSSTTIERNVTSVELRSGLSKRFSLVASYEYKYYFNQVSKSVYEASLGVIWTGHGMALYSELF